MPVNTTAVYNPHQWRKITEKDKLAKTGRPTVITPNVVAKLLSILQRGISIRKACEYGKIDRASFYRKYESDKEFRNQIDDARNFATIVAAEVVVDDIVKNKNVQTAKWYLEKKDPEEFGTKPHVEINNQQNNNEYHFVKTEDLPALLEAAKAEGAPIDDPVELLNWCEGDYHANSLEKEEPPEPVLP